jgi:hypothetical protein
MDQMCRSVGRFSRRGHRCVTPPPPRACVQQRERRHTSARCVKRPIRRAHATGIVVPPIVGRPRNSHHGWPHLQRRITTQRRCAVLHDQWLFQCARYPFLGGARQDAHDPAKGAGNQHAQRLPREFGVSLRLFYHGTRQAGRHADAENMSPRQVHCDRHRGYPERFDGAKPGLLDAHGKGAMRHIVQSILRMLYLRRKLRSQHLTRGLFVHEAFVPDRAIRNFCAGGLRRSPRPILTLARVTIIVPARWPWTTRHKCPSFIR